MTGSAGGRACPAAAGVGLVIAVCRDVGGKRVQRHFPSHGARGAFGDANMRHGHPGTTVELIELHENLGGRGVSCGQAEFRGRNNMAVLVGHRLGVDQALVLDDLAILTGEPPAPRSL
jgi:hypothetical protein